MESLSNFTLKQQPLFSSNLSLSFPKPTFISFPKPLLSRPSVSSVGKVKVCYTHIPGSVPASSKKTKQVVVPSFTPKITKTLNPFALLKTPLTVAVATAAIFLSGLSHKPLPAIAETPKATVEEGVSEEESERKLEHYVAMNPNDVEGLRSLMEIRVKTKKLDKAVEVLNRLIEVEPEEKEWVLLRAHMYAYMGETETAKNAFEEIIAMDPTRVEAFHGLVMAVSQCEEGGSAELDVVSERIKGAIDKCKKEKLKDEVRDFKLLIAQVRVIEGKYDEALRVYEELAKEEPKDFRPYLCQGIIYTLLRKKDEAEKMFEKYKRLVPEGHPYARYFDDNMIATKVFSQMAENEREKVGATS